MESVAVDDLLVCVCDMGVWVGEGLESVGIFTHRQRMSCICMSTCACIDAFLFSYRHIL